jgi:hypothetical protein
METAVKALTRMAIAAAMVLLILDIRALVKAQHGVLERQGYQARQLADRHAQQLEQDIRLRMDAALDEVKAMHGSADLQLQDTRAMIAEQLGEVLTRYDQTEQDANSRLVDITATVTALKPAIANLGTITTHVSGIWAQVEDAAPLFLDCDHNPDCAFNRFQGTSKAIEKMAEEGAKAAPAIAEAAANTGKQFAGIAADVHQATTDFVTPKTFWQKVKAWLETAGKIGARFL